MFASQAVTLISTHFCATEPKSCRPPANQCKRSSKGHRTMPPTNLLIKFVHSKREVAYETNSWGYQSSTYWTLLINFITERSMNNKSNAKQLQNLILVAAWAIGNKTLFLHLQNRWLVLIVNVFQFSQLPGFCQFSLLHSTVITLLLSTNEEQILKYERLNLFHCSLPTVSLLPVLPASFLLYWNVH